MRPPDAGDISPQGIRPLDDAIARLSDRDAGVRERAAAEIFAEGTRRARACTREWLRDAELGPRFVRDRSGEPRTTVGVAVRPEAFERIREANGAPRLAQVPPDQDAREFELDFGEGASLDILTARDGKGEGAIARFLRRQGEGIQQVELEVNDLREATEELGRRYGVRSVYAEARRGADGAWVNFFLVAAGEGKLLIELVQAAAGKDE